MGNENRINVDVICLLRFSPNSGLVFVDYEKIQRPLDKDFELLKAQFLISNKDAKSILIYVKEHPKLKVLLGTYDYCSKLNGTNQGINGDLKAVEAKYPSVFKDYKTKDELKKSEKETLLFDLEERLLAYYLKNSYEICEKERQQNFILAYSHRKVGFSTKYYQLNPNFSIELKTNFGYGYVSYFYTRIIYKELEIIPFSDWIIYEKARLFEIIRYSAKHALDNESWKEAMEYSKTACNLSIKDETEFVKKYVISECERMVAGLEEFLEGTKFKFIDKDRMFTDNHKDGHELIEFRGEKLSGALNFIEKIILFKGIIEIEDFVNRVEICNRKVQPMLKKEDILITQELFDLNEILIVLEPIFNSFEQKHKNYEALREALREELFWAEETIILNDQEFDIKFIGLNPEYKEFNVEYILKKGQYFALINQIYSLETTKENIIKYTNEINSYFEQKTSINSPLSKF
jgi:hypothetical protein